MKISSKRRELPEKKDLVWMALISVAEVVLLAVFFYRSMWATIPLGWVGVWNMTNLIKKNRLKREQEFTAQFRECILSVATLLQSGYSAENAFMECRGDMVMLYGEEARICKELKQIRRGLHINISLEELLSDMAGRSNCEEISRFAQIFALAKRSGGNMAEIIRGTASLISRRIELRQEMEILLSGKKMELTIMRLIPFGILLYVELGNPGYFDVLYYNLQGVLIMTACLLLYLGAYALGERIMNRLWQEMA